MDILVVGSIAMDSIKTPKGNRDNILGGSCTYFSYASSFFTHVDLVGTVGKDFPKEHIKLIQDKGIGTSGLDIRDGRTFRWEGAYEGDMSQAETLVTELNVFETFQPVIPEELKKPDMLFLANIDPDLQLDVLKQVERPKFTACDTMNLWINIKKNSLLDLLANVDAFILNDAEARQILGYSCPLVKAAKEISKLGPTTVVIKKGEHGALLYHNNEYFFASPYPVEEVVDPTGAGDTFAGGFMGALARMDEINLQNMKTAMIYGCCMASFTCEDFSLDRLKKLDAREIEARFNDFKKMATF